jgi:2-phosphosulfolactate phosphatase
MERAFSEWGQAGVELLRDRVVVLVIVDVLSFSTAVDIGVSRGAIVYPFPLGDADAARQAAARVGAVLAQPAGPAAASSASRPIACSTFQPARN